jgi:hypothetical protein
MILTPQPLLRRRHRATAGTTIAAIAAAITIAAEAAFAVATETAATVVAITVAIALRIIAEGTFLVLFDANR